MKRKKGNKGGPKKVSKTASSVVDEPAYVPVNTEDNIGSDNNDDDADDIEKDVGLLYEVSNKLSNMASIDAGVVDDKSVGKAGTGRVKVKLKSARVVEASGEGMVTPQPSMNEVAIEKEDSSGAKNARLEMTERKAGSIKIKGLGSLSDGTQDKKLSKVKGPIILQTERNLELLVNEKTADLSVARSSLQQRETTLPYVASKRNEKELSDALEVIKKVMKMDAAEPFNTPVNPIALGIPDYFDVIDYPMDFGTVCHALEHGSKYMNSEDVYKDVEFIWENCYKYNNKGDYIIDLMKRVKKNFMKYWVAAGLYSNMPGNGTTESTQAGDGVGITPDTLYPKSKSKNKRQRYGIDRHKSDCLCAVCAVRRRRKERDESQIPVGNARHPQEIKLEKKSPVDNQGSKRDTSSLDPSQETDTNGDVEVGDTEEKLETSGSVRSAKQHTVNNEMGLKQNTRTNWNMSLGNVTRDDFRQQYEEEEIAMDPSTQLDDENGEMDVDEQDLSYHLQETDNNQGESAEGSRFKLHGSHRLQENHSFLPICRSIFSSDHKSLWNGPHSLNRSHVPVREGLIHSAVAAFMKL